MDNQVLTAIKTRRSIRRYRPEQIADQELSAILEAGRYAPSGGNNQTNHFVVIQNPKVLEELKKLVAEEFAKMEVAEDTYQSLKSAILLSKKGGYDFTYQAPTLVITANRKGYGNAMADCAVALENMMLAATAIQVGSCWINQLTWLDENPIIRVFVENLGITEQERICGSLALGYSAQQEAAPLERKGNRVTYIR